jgi:hypothetical protein
MRKISISLLAAVLCLTCAISMSAQSDNVLRNPQVSKAAFAVTPPLRDMVKNQPTELQFGYHQAPPVQRPKAALLDRIQKNTNYSAIHDPVAQNTNQPATIPVDQLDFLGVGVGFFGYSVPDAPTDGNLSIGDNQIVQWVNVQFAVFDLNGNNLLFNGQHYVNGNVVFSGLPHCGASNSGDIIAQWDKIAHRWVMYQPRFSAPYYDCFAISQTADATGAYYTYEFPTYQNSNNFPDYPKVGVWPNGYYVSHNDFLNLQAYVGAMPCAYDRVKMLAGDPSALGVCFLDNSNGTLFDDSMLPADVDDANALPNGIDPIFVGSIDNFASDSNVYYYPFHFDPVNPANSTFSCVNGACKIPVATYSNASGNAPEPGGNSINTLSDRLMYRLAYRILPAPTPAKDLLHDNRSQEWLVSHAVANNGSAAVRWYEFRSPVKTTTPTTFQQGTYAPDATNRFMSSLARDKMGNIAMSYTVSSSTVNPTIAFTGRAPGDPLGQMGAETILVPAAGYQTGTSNRWGDYYDMALSNDGCTFVTTGEYYQTVASFHWSTRIGKLKFANCTPSN